MRRILAVAVAVVVMSASSVQAAPGDMNVGFNAGVNVAKPKAEAGTKTGTGFVIGGQFQYGLASMLYLNTGLRFIQKNVNLDLVGRTVDATFTYIEIPAHAMMKFMEEGPFTPLAFFGPTLGYKIADSVVVRDDSGAEVVANNQLGTSVQAFDFSLELGAGGEYKATPKIGIELLGSYLYGITNVNKTVGGTVNNRGWLILAGLNYTL